MFAAACRSAAEDRLPPKLAFTRAANELRFDTGVLKGTLGEEGKSLGLRPLTHRATGAQIAGAFGILSPYRLLTSHARFGTAAWDWPRTCEVQADGAARVRWSADKEHPLDLTGVYRWSPPIPWTSNCWSSPSAISTCSSCSWPVTSTDFRQALAPVTLQGPGLLSGAGTFVEAVKADGDWLTFPRDRTAAAIFGDGRWTRPPNPVTWKIRPAVAAPMALRRDAKSGLTAVLMSRPADCFAVSMPYGEDPHRSVYLSLFGRDLKAGKAASAGARLVIGKDLTEDRAMELYRNYAHR